MENLNGQLDDITIEKIRVARQEAQNDLIVISKRMKIHQRVYDDVRREYYEKLNRYKKLDLSFAMNTKRTICKAKKARTVRKVKTVKNIMPAKVKSLLNTLPEEARQRIIAAYED